MALKLSRREFNLLLGASALSGMGRAFAADPTGQIVVGTWGGDYQKFLQDYIATPFLEPKGVTTVFDTNTDSARKIKLMAERRLPRGSMDIAALTASGAYEMWKNDAVIELDFDRIPAYKNVPGFLKTKHSVAQIYTGRAILYNPTKVTTAPTSYKDLWDPKYQGKIGVIDIQYQTTMESAALAFGGSPTNYEPGKEKLLELKKMGVRIYPSNEAMAQALKTEEVWMCIMWHARARQWQAAGVPVELAYPSEGTGVYVSGFSIPKNARNKDAAYAFLNASLQPEAQANFAKNMGYMPPSPNAPIPADVMARISIPEEAKKKVMLQDDEYLLKNDAQLKDWWDKVFKA